MSSSSPLEKETRGVPLLPDGDIDSCQITRVSTRYRPDEQDRDDMVLC